MAKKKTPSETTKRPASQTISPESALVKLMSTLLDARETRDSEGNRLNPGEGNLDALRILLESGAKDHLVDTYYMVCGFQNLRDLDLKVIRADMLVERATRSFAESRASNPKVIDELRQYAPIRNFAKAMTEPGEDGKVWVAAKHLSDARNLVAHQLESPAIEKELTDFFCAVGVKSTDMAKDIEIAALTLCASIFTMKQNWVTRKKMIESVFEDFESGQLVRRE